MEGKARSREQSEELVESGTFGIDRKRALEKLARFQLENPLDGVLLLARAAIGSNATRLDTRCQGEAGLTLSWDGKTLPGSFLASPYDALFHYDGPDGERKRQIATALLALTRMDGVEAAIESGGDRCRIHGTGETLEATDSNVGGVRVSIRFDSGKQREAAIDRLLAKTAMYTIPLSVNDQERLPSSKLFRQPGKFEAPGISGDFVRDNLRPIGVLDIYKQGVYVERVSLEGLHWVHGRVEASNLPLDLSLGGAVRGKEFEALLSTATAACRRLIPKSTSKMNATTHYGARLMIGTTMALTLMGAGFTGMWWFLNQDPSSTLQRVLAGAAMTLGYGGMVLMEPLLDRFLGKKFE